MATLKEKLNGLQEYTHIQEELTYEPEIQKMLEDLVQNESESDKNLEINSNNDKENYMSNCSIFCLL